jgi:hypothetical protein
VIFASFEGGPYDGLLLGLAGTPPGYLMLMDHPADPDYPAPIVVGADFDDDWPGQQRYNLAQIDRAAEITATAIYRHGDG